MKKLLGLGIITLSAIGLSSCDDEVKQISFEVQLERIKNEYCGTSDPMINYDIDLVSEAKDSNVKGTTHSVFSVMDVCKEAVSVVSDATWVTVYYEGSRTGYSRFGQYTGSSIEVSYGEGEIENFIFELEVTNEIAYREQSDFDDQLELIKSRYCDGTSPISDDYDIDLRLLSKDYTVINSAKLIAPFNVSDVCNEAIEITTGGGYITVNYIEGIDGYVRPGQTAGNNVGLGYGSEENLADSVVVLAVDELVTVIEM